MSSSSDAALAAVSAAAVLECIAPVMRSPGSVLLIDGRSGSGKTTLARWLAPRLRATVLQLEEVYADWTGLDTASTLLAERLLPDFAAGRPVRWRAWDWGAGKPGGIRTLPVGDRLVVEGCGALRAASRRRATAAIVLEVSAAERRRRILARDPAAAMPGHAVWAIEERRFAAAASPARLADLVLRGGVRLPPDRPAEADTVTP